MYLCKQLLRVDLEQALPHPDWVALGWLPGLSVPQFLHLFNQDNSGTYLIVLL